jgi:cell division protein FtsB
MKVIVKKLFWLFALTGLAFVLFLPGYVQIKALRDKNFDLQGKNKRLQVENSLLEQELKRIDKDKLYQEKILREKLGVVRKDEVPVKMVPTD